ATGKERSPQTGPDASGSLSRRGDGCENATANAEPHACAGRQSPEASVPVLRSPVCSAWKSSRTRLHLSLDCGNKTASECDRLINRPFLIGSLYQIPPPDSRVWPLSSRNFACLFPAAVRLFGVARKSPVCYTWL